MATAGQAQTLTPPKEDSKAERKGGETKFVQVSIPLRDSKAIFVPSLLFSVHHFNPSKEDSKANGKLTPRQQAFVFQSL